MYRPVIFILSVFALVLMNACNDLKVFGPADPYERYVNQLKKTGLSETAMGKQWIRAGEKSLADSFRVALPYRESGYFAAGEPRAGTIRFQPRRGQKITITLHTRPSSGAKLFMHLWSINGDRMKLLKTADSSVIISYEQDNNRPLVLRLQPELLVSVSYDLTVIAEPALAFPVPENDGKKIGSFWGDARDAGARSHEGIDIFDRFRTPVVAAADGMVIQVNENRLGGKTVWLRPEGKDYILYYAHLDSQTVHTLQRVKQGDTLGLMGNTGNARYTPTHLHFGIYSNGAIDPLPFVQQVNTRPRPLQGDTSLLGNRMKIKGKTALLFSPWKNAGISATLPAGTAVKPVSASDGYYLVQLPDESMGYVPVQELQDLSSGRQTKVVLQDTLVFASADTAAAVVTKLKTGDKVEVYGIFSDYVLISRDKLYGWVSRRVINR